MFITILLIRQQACFHRELPVWFKGRNIHSQMLIELTIKRTVNNSANCRQWLFKLVMVSSPFYQWKWKHSDGRPFAQGHVSKGTEPRCDQVCLTAEPSLPVSVLHTPLFSKCSDSKPSPPLDAGNTKRRQTQPSLQRTDPRAGDHTSIC